MQIQLLALIAEGLGWKNRRDLTDPADLLEDEFGAPPPQRDRATVVAEFLAAANRGRG